MRAHMMTPSKPSPLFDTAALLQFRNLKLRDPSPLSSLFSELRALSELEREVFEKERLANAISRFQSRGPAPRGRISSELRAPKRFTPTDVCPRAARGGETALEVAEVCDLPWSDPGQVFEIVWRHEFRSRRLRTIQRRTAQEVALQDAAAAAGARWSVPTQRANSANILAGAAHLTFLRWAFVPCACRVPHPRSLTLGDARTLMQPTLVFLRHHTPRPSASRRGGCLSGNGARRLSLGQTR
jgi:hypothetical protein